MVRGSLICVGTLLVFTFGFQLSEDLTIARTMAYSFSFLTIIYVFDCRSERYTIFEIGIFTNMLWFGSKLFNINASDGTLSPVFQPIFKTYPLELIHWAVILGFLVKQHFQGAYRSLKKMYLRYFVYVDHN